MCFKTSNNELKAPRNSKEELADEEETVDSSFSSFSSSCSSLALVYKLEMHLVISVISDGTKIGNVGNTKGPNFVHKLANVENVVERNAAIDNLLDCFFNTLLKGTNM